MKKLAFLALATLGTGLGAAALLGTQSHAADHLDSTALAANPMADINDVYTWVTGSKLNLVMTVSPADNGSRHFGSSVQYAFHLQSKAALTDVGNVTGTNTSVICTFASDTDVSCWVVSEAGTVLDYVKGDPSTSTGATSTDGKLKVHAGRHSDPFFFNLGGFRAAVNAVETVAALPTFMVDAAGCPTSVDATQGAQLRAALGAPSAAPGAPCPANVADCFAALNVMGLVVQVDTSLVNSGTNTFLAVWGSTHQGS